MTFTTGNMFNFADYVMTYENGIIRIMRNGQYIDEAETQQLAYALSAIIINKIDNTELPICN